MHQPWGHVRPPPLAAGELEHRAFRELGELQQREQFVARAAASVVFIP
jgi:hypothetical protein